MVVVITECSIIDGITQRRLVWNRLLPAVGDEPLTSGKDYKRLLRSNLLISCRWYKGKQTHLLPGSMRINLLCLSRINWAGSLSVFNFNPKEVIMTVTQADGLEYDLPFGYKQWEKTSIDAYLRILSKPKDVSPG